MIRAPMRKAALFTGVFITLIGVLLLVWRQESADVVARWWPSAITLAGAYLLFRSFFKKERPSALFGGLLMFLVGTFVLLINVGAMGSLSYKDLWPSFVGFVGISLIPYGARYRRTVRVTLVIPGIILIFLSGVFLLFSLQVVKQSFSEFVLAWWPMLLVLMGITLVASASFGRKE